MSSNLYWAPPPTEIADTYIGLKYEIGQFLYEEYHGESIDTEVGRELIPFLRGIMSISGGERYVAAECLVKAIEKYGKVKLYTKS